MGRNRLDIESLKVIIRIEFIIIGTVNDLLDGLRKYWIWKDNDDIM